MTDIIELAVIPRENALAVFTGDGKLAPYLDLIRGEIDKFVPNIETKSGRDEIASFAFKVTKCKTALEGIGKELADEQKEIPKKIDAARKLVRDTLDKWRDEVRKPLTDWEAVEEARISTIKARIAELVGVANDRTPRTSEVLRDRLAEVEAEHIAEAGFAEYLEAALGARQSAITHLNAMIAETEQRERDAAELEKLRAERAERDAQEAAERAAREKAERDERIAREAAAEAEAKAAREIEAAAERARQAAESAAKREAELVRQAEDQKRRAEQAEKEAKAKAERELAAKAQAEAEATRKREENKKHCAKINRDAMAAFVGAGIDEEQAKKIITLIAGGKIPNVSIKY